MFAEYGFFHAIVLLIGMALYTLSSPHPQTPHPPLPSPPRWDVGVCLAAHLKAGLPAPPTTACRDTNKSHRL